MESQERRGEGLESGLPAQGRAMNPLSLWPKGEEARRRAETEVRSS